MIQTPQEVENDIKEPQGDLQLTVDILDNECMVAASSSSMALADKRRQIYKYDCLVHVKKGQPGPYNVFGVVKFSKVPVKSRGTDFHQVLSIADESLEVGDKLVITLFYKSMKEFPSVSVGDVIRFHRLEVEMVYDEMKGRLRPGSSWLFVHNDVDNPCVSSLSFTYTENDKNRVRELQKWAEDVGLLLDHCPLLTLSSLVATQYCDLVCQLVATIVEEEGVCFVARVWDGTRCQYPSAATSSEVDQVDHALKEKAADLTVDVWLYDDHFHSYQAIQPGQFLKLHNLHAALHKREEAARGDNANTFPKLELAIHRGTSYGRGVAVLHEQCPEVLAVKQRMERLVSTTETSHPSNTSAQSNRKDPAWSVTPGLLREHTQHGHDGPLPAATFSSPQAAGVIRAGCSRWLDSGPAITSSTDTVGFSSVKQVCTGVGSHNRQVITSSSSSANSQNDDRIVGEKKNNSGDTSYPDNELRIMLSTCGSGSKDQPSLHSSEETCMLQTASVISSHHHISHTAICEVLAQEIPSKFRVLAHLVDFHPNTLDPAEFLQQLCPKCSFLKKVVGDVATPDSEMERETPLLQRTTKSLTSVTSKLAGLFGGQFASWSPWRLGSTCHMDLCPQCSADSKTVSLELIYMLRLVLQDSSGDFLVANLWRDHAVTFFRGVKPETVLKDKGLFQDLVQTLRSLCVRQQNLEPSAPKLDCCLFSYRTSAGVNFHIFDTVLV